MDAKKLYLDYAKDYDAENGMNRLKIIHTLAVADVMDEITAQMGLKKQLQKLAHITAVFHDIGRFEQVKRYGTFLDHLSEDHADLGCAVLMRESMLGDLDEREQKMVLTAVRNHNKLTIEKDLDQETLLLCRLIRDADKCDIFRVFAQEDMVDTMGETIEQVEQETITDVVFESIMQHHCVDKTIRRTGLDKWIGFLGFMFDMNFKQTLERVKTDGFYRKPFDEADFKDPLAAQRVEQCLSEVERYMQEQIHVDQT